MRQRVSEMPLELPPEAPNDSAGPAASGMSIKPEDRIRDLEQALREERRALQEAEERYRALELKYQELSQRAQP